MGVVAGRLGAGEESVALATPPGAVPSVRPPVKHPRLGLGSRAVGVADVGSADDAQGAGLGVCLGLGLGLGSGWQSARRCWAFATRVCWAFLTFVARSFSTFAALSAFFASVVSCAESASSTSSSAWATSFLLFWKTAVTRSSAASALTT